LKAGLTCKVVPSGLLVHPFHKPRVCNRWVLVQLSWEHCKFFVRYGRGCAGLFDFFVRPLDYRLFVFHFPVKVVGVLYWLLRKWGCQVKRGFLSFWNKPLVKDSYDWWDQY
jgi:hypothetical protein